MHGRLTRAIPLFVLLLLLIAPSLALTMDVTGDTAGNAVTVTLDREAFTSFTLNNATPVYAYGSEVRFIPVQSGTLTISAVSGNEEITKTITISTSGGGDSGGGDSGGDTWRTVTVSPGTVEITAHNSQKVYSVDRLTVLGVLDASGVSYTATDEDWGGTGLFVDSVDGQKGVYPAGWMYQINGVSGGPVQFESVNDGDKIVWYYSQSMSDTPEDSNHCIYLKVSVIGGSSSGGSSGTQNETQENSTTTSVNTSSASSMSTLLSLPAGVSLTRTEQGQMITLDTKKAAAAGEEITYDGANVTIARGNFRMRIGLSDYHEQSGVITGLVDQVTLETVPLFRQIENVGNVSSSFSADLHAVPDGARVSITLSGNIAGDLKNALYLCALDSHRHVSATAYVMAIDTGSLSDGTDIGESTVVMTAPSDWVQTHGGTDAILILHQRTDGTVEALTTRFAGLDTDGNMRFEADSPGGLSIFALAASVETTETEPIGTTPVAEQTAGNTSQTAPISDPWFLAIGGACLLLAGGVIGYVISRYSGGRK